MAYTIRNHRTNNQIKRKQKIKETREVEGETIFLVLDTENFDSWKVTEIPDWETKYFGDKKFNKKIPKGSKWKNVPLHVCQAYGDPKHFIFFKFEENNRQPNLVYDSRTRTERELYDVVMHTPNCAIPRETLDYLEISPREIFNDVLLDCYSDFMGMGENDLKENYCFCREIDTEESFKAFYAIPFYGQGQDVNRDEHIGKTWLDRSDVSERLARRMETKRSRQARFKVERQVRDTIREKHRSRKYQNMEDSE